MGDPGRKGQGTPAFLAGPFLRATRKRFLEKVLACWGRPRKACHRANQTSRLTCSCPETVFFPETAFLTYANSCCGRLQSCRFPGSPHPGSSSTSLPLESGLAWLLALINKTWWECRNSSLDPNRSQSFHSSEYFCQCIINKAQPAHQRVRFWTERGPRWAPDMQGRPSETT